MNQVLKVPTVSLFDYTYFFPFLKKSDKSMVSFFF